MSNRAGAIERLRTRRVVLGLVAIVAAAIAVGVVLAATSGSSSPKSAASSASAGGSSGTTVEAVSEATLRTLPAAVRHSVYWAGPAADATYELTRTPNGRVYIRYLTGQARVGSPRPDFLTIGTYVVPNAAAAVRAAAAQPGAVSVPLRGGVAFYNRARPTSVYFAYSGSNVQVETYDPSALVARRLVETGAIKPVS